MLGVSRREWGFRDFGLRKNERDGRMLTFTVLGVLSVSRTSADSVLAMGVRSGTATCTTDLSASNFAHQGMALKCGIGSSIG